MRRRRQNNTLLKRILIISIVAHIILLPILARFGAFKRIQQQFVEVTAVRLPPPPPMQERQKPEAKKQAKAEKPVQKARPGSTTSHARQAARNSHFNGPKVVASAGGPAGGGDGGPTVDNTNASGKAGQLPTPETTTKPPTDKQTEPKPTEPAKPVEPTHPVETPREVARVDKPTPAPVEPKPLPMPKAPVFTEAEPALAVSQEPQPTIPDDLRADALDKTCVVRFTVGPDGKTIRVEVAQSSGSDELDRAALQAAKQWTFKPATRDGEPVESQVNLHIQFQVN